MVLRAKRDSWICSLSGKMKCDGSCCCCCASSKGASFFCTSIHVFLGLYLSIKWVLVTYINGLNNNYFEDNRMQLIYPLLLIYLCIFFVLGCVNFTAVERESPGILTWSMRVFLLLQVAMLLTNTLLAFAFPEWDNDLALHRFHHIKYMLINVVATSLYFFIIWRFIYSLENGIYVIHKKRKKKCGGGGGGGSSGPRNNSDSPGGASAPWSSGSLGVSHLHRPSVTDNSPRREAEPGDEQTLPLKSVAFAEPQPCSSKSSQ